MPGIALPFDADHLDQLMTDAGIDLVLATSKHNVQYLLGGYRFFFFAAMEAIGLSRYLSVVGYPRNRPASGFYVGNPMEGWQQKAEPLWTPTILNEAKTADAAAEVAAGRIRKLGLANGTIAVEMPFLPAEAYLKLEQLLPHSRLVDAVVLLEELRAVKRPGELQIIREASEGIVASMLATFGRARPGISTRELADILRSEETGRGLVFDYCLAATGSSFDRAPSNAEWVSGGTLSLDSGGTQRGYVGDLARMAVIGEPTSEMRQALAEVDAIQQAARSAVRSGQPGRQIYDAIHALWKNLTHPEQFEFEAHGIGLVSHEVPHLVDHGSWPYPGTHRDLALQAGMVLSIETTLRNPVLGFVKLEDTVVVTDAACDVYGDSARGWNVVGV
jgi:Xaa-Pro aminopeptidase